VTAPRVYLDSNVLITAYETESARSDHAWWILEAIEAREFLAVTSELTLAEILVGIFRKGNRSLADHYQAIVTSGSELEVVPVNRNVLVEAAALRAMTRSLKLPDAIHVATARMRTCQFIISDDRRLPIAPGLQVVQLGPQALDVMRAQVR
jgi:predicted nucleic acid-binding protein